MLQEHSTTGVPESHSNLSVLINALNFWYLLVFFRKKKKQLPRYKTQSKRGCVGTTSVIRFEIRRIFFMIAVTTFDLPCTVHTEIFTMVKHDCFLVKRHFNNESPFYNTQAQEFDAHKRTTRNTGAICQPEAVSFQTGHKTPKLRFFTEM